MARLSVGGQARINCLVRSAEGTLDALRRAAQVGGARVPVDPEWTEYGINPPPVPPKRRGDDRSPLQATNLPAAERDVEASRGESYAPKLEADRVRDADGSIRGDDGDHFGSGAIRPAMEALTLEDFRALQARRWRGRFF